MKAVELPVAVAVSGVALASDPSHGVAQRVTGKIDKLIFDLDPLPSGAKR